jgi:hypothetical protein
MPCKMRKQVPDEHVEVSRGGVPFSISSHSLTHVDNLTHSLTSSEDIKFTAVSVTVQMLATLLLRLPALHC